MKPRTLWLVFTLIVVAMICIPRLLHAQEPVLVHCDKGFCVMAESTFSVLIELAKLAGKNCI